MQVKIAWLRLLPSVPAFHQRGRTTWHPEWHTLITYTHGANGLVPTMVGPNPMQPPTRYLVPDDRDFFAVYQPLPGPVTVPFK